RRLGRALDLVVVDAMEPLGSYKVMPVGRAREPLTGLKRAEFVVINKANLVSEGQLRDLESCLQPILGESYERKRVLGEYHIQNVSRVSGHDPIPDNFWQSSLALVSAIGRPEGFVHLVEQKGAKVAVDIRFQDHHR